MTPAVRTLLTDADWAVLHMMRGSHWEPGATLVLPSGIILNGEQLATLLPRES